MIAAVDRQALRSCVCACVFSSEADLRRRVETLEADLAEAAARAGRERIALAEEAARAVSAADKDFLGPEIVD